MFTTIKLHGWNALNRCANCFFDKNFYNRPNQQRFTWNCFAHATDVRNHTTIIGYNLRKTASE